MYKIFEWQIMQSSQSLYEREKARPERVDFWAGGGRRHTFEVVFQCPFVCVFKKDIRDPFVRKATVKSYDAGKRPPERGSQVYETIDFSSVLLLGTAVVGLKDESIIQWVRGILGRL